jgi:hypothetical protein
MLFSYRYLHRHATVTYRYICQKSHICRCVVRFDLGAKNENEIAGQDVFRRKIALVLMLLFPSFEVFNYWFRLRQFVEYNLKFYTFATLLLVFIA